jgi:SAM-dependent methyltransferase
MQPAGPPPGPRDANEWYTGVDPIAVVDRTLLELVHANAGHELLDLGCGLGGYAKLLGEQGHAVRALDVTPAYVNVARGIGVDAATYDGSAIPLPDKSVDTIFMVEVLEHVPDPPRLLPELARVARRNVIITVPNNTQAFSAPVEWSHMLETDHKHFFTRDSLASLLAPAFSTIDVTEVGPIDGALSRDLLPRWLWAAHRVATRLHLARDRHFFRLVANAKL